MVHSTDLPEGAGDTLNIPPMKTSLESTDVWDLDRAATLAALATKLATTTMPKSWESHVLAALQSRGYYTLPHVPLTKWQRVQQLLRLMRPHVKLWFGRDEPGLYGEDE